MVRKGDFQSLNQSSILCDPTTQMYQITFYLQAPAIEIYQYTLHNCKQFTVVNGNSNVFIFEEYVDYMKICKKFPEYIKEEVSKNEY